MQTPDHICSGDAQPIFNGATTKKQQIRALLHWIKLNLMYVFIRTLSSVRPSLLRSSGGPLGGSSNLNPTFRLQVITLGFELGSLSLQGNEYVALSTFPRPSRLKCAEIFLENRLRTWNVLTFVCSEKKQESYSEVSESKSVIAVPKEMGVMGKGPYLELTRSRGLGVGKKLPSAFQNGGSHPKIGPRGIEGCGGGQEDPSVPVMWHPCGREEIHKSLKARAVDDPQENRVR